MHVAHPMQGCLRKAGHGLQRPGRAAQPACPCESQACAPGAQGAGPAWIFGLGEAGVEGRGKAAWRLSERPGNCAAARGMAVGRVAA